MQRWKDPLVSALVVAIVLAGLGIGAYLLVQHGILGFGSWVEESRRARP